MNWLRCFRSGIDKRSGNGIESLPDDLIREILIRLPAHRLWECRRVCKRWLHVIVNPRFAQQHAQRAPSLVFLQNTLGYLHADKARKGFFYFDHAMEKVRLTQHWKNNHMWSLRPILYFSCHGLLLFEPWNPPEWSFFFFIGNPITGELQRFKKPTKSGLFCGFFFHSSEYKLLHFDGRWSSNPRPPIYSIFSLRTQTWKNIRNVPHDFYPAFFKPPVNINKYNLLFWMVFGNNFNFDCKHSIIVFNMDTEKFYGFPHPDHPYIPYMCREYAREHAFVRDGSWTWTPLYTLPYRTDFERYPFFGLINADIRLVTIRNMQVLLIRKEINERCLVMIDYTKTVVTLK
ncbi:hypothetical protein COLO4_10477 [Corchorus olitorius]|uniref:F-box domain-containing protein n=1 Tax=Corchorus olitorius TaxID=93759 RepID=A0A1R3K8E9_9ROSI|nr:hypothetical protein COLO4_10477 [Corchorus olitorius]